MKLLQNKKYIIPYILAILFNSTAIEFSEDIVRICQRFGTYQQ
jgi:hypothetical protein